MRLVLLCLALATVGCDRVTKHVAASALAGSPGQSYWGDLLWLGYAENTGAFLSLGAGLPGAARTVLFTWGTGAMLLALAAVAIRAHAWTAIGLTLFVAGGLSNWFDRATTGHVVDFMNVGIGSLRTGVFNMADVAIMIGAGLFVLDELRRNTAKHPDPNGEAGGNGENATRRRGSADTDSESPECD
jgi:signal peptidase II